MLESHNYKCPNNSSNIDLILNNCSRSFFKTETNFTGLPDLRNLVLSVFKRTFMKSNPKETVCRHYVTNNSNQDLRKQFSSEQPKDYASFEKVFLSILEEHAPLQKKLILTNHAPYITKALM